MPHPELFTLLCRDHVELGITCLSSILANLGPFKLVIYNDGSLCERQFEDLSKTFPGCEFVSRASVQERVEAQLESHPRCRAFRRTNLFGSKLIDIPLLAEDPVIRYCDSDVYAYSLCRSVFELSAEFTGAFMQDSQEAYALRPWDLLPPQRIKVAKALNAGFFAFRRNAFDLDFIEWFLSRDIAAFKKFPLWVEQTAWAALSQRSSCAAWDPQKVRVIRDPACLTEELVIGHFTSDVRSLLRNTPASRLPRAETGIEFYPLKSLSCLSLARSQINRRLRRL